MIYCECVSTRSEGVLTEPESADHARMLHEREEDYINGIEAFVRSHIGGTHRG